MKKIMLLVAFICLSLTSTFAVSSDKPVIKIITSLPVGSGPDSLVRKLAARLEPVWDSKIIIDNRPGGNGLIALQAYQADTSPTTLFFGDSSNFTTLPLLLNQAAVLENLEPLAPVTMAETMIITDPGVRNFADLKNKLSQSHSYGSWGVGSPGHFNALILLDALNYESSGVHIPYKDYGAWFMDTSNKNLLFGFATPGSAGNLEQANKLNFVGVTGNKRHSKWPNVPSTTELLGNTEFVKPWVAFYIKTNISSAAKIKLAQDIKKEIDSAEYRQTMNAMNYDHWDTSSSEFKKFAESQTRLYKKIIGKYKIQIN
jgi:tripartite-type tricarboxylate transporter receptor subunit TctC